MAALWNNIAGTVHKRFPVDETELIEWEWHATCSRQFDSRYRERIIITRCSVILNHPAFGCVFAIIKRKKCISASDTVLRLAKTPYLYTNLRSAREEQAGERYKCVIYDGKKRGSHLNSCENLRLIRTLQIHTRGSYFHYVGFYWILFSYIALRSVWSMQLYNIKIQKYSKKINK